MTIIVNNDNDNMIVVAIETILNIETLLNDDNDDSDNNWYLQIMIIRI